MSKMVETIEWNDETVNSFWDFYSQYPELYFTYQYGNKIIETVFSYFGTDARVLDYGCGTGFLVKHLVNKPIQVYGTDSSPVSLQSVRNRFGNEKNFRGVFEVQQLLADRNFEGYFDVVCLIEVVEHLSDAHMNSVLSNIKKLLKTNGRIIITTPNEEDLSASLVYCPMSKKVFHRWQHVRSWSKNSLSAYLSTFRFEPIKVFSTDFSATKLPPVTIKSVAKKFLEKTGLKKKTELRGPHLVYIGYNKG